MGSCPPRERSALVELEDPDGTALFEVVHALGDVAAPQRNSTTPTGRHGDHLLAILFPGNRRRNDAGAGLEGPQFLAGLGVNTLQVAFRGAVEHQATSGCQNATPQRGVVLVFPDDLAGSRIDGTQCADVVFVQGLDGEASAQVGSALLVGNRFVPDVHGPFVGRDVEQPSLLAIGDLLLVLAAQEGRGSEHNLALLAVASARVARTVRVVIDRTAGLQVDALGPGDLLDEREGVEQLAVGAVVHEEETVTVGLAASLDDLAGLRILVVKGDEFVNTVEVPAVVRGVLVVPDDLASVRVDGDGGGREQVVARTQVAVPRGRVAGAGKDQVGFGIVGGAVPGGCAAGLPQVAGPGGVEGAGDAVFGGVAILVVGVAHVTFNGRANPQLLAGARVARFDTADNAEFATGNAGDQLAAGDDRGGRGRVASCIVINLFLPDDFAGVLVQGDQLGVEGGEDDQVVIQGGATVDHVAAGHDAVRQAALVFPQLLAGLGINSKQTAVGGGDEHLAIVDDRLRFLAALLFATEGHRPDRDEVLDGLGVDLGHRAVALALGAEAEAHDVAGGLGIVENVFIGDDCRSRAADKCGCDEERERQLAALLMGMTMHGLSPWLSDGFVFVVV